LSTDRSVTTARTTTVEEALALILSSLKRMAAADLPLADVGGRVLASSVTATEDLWPFPRAAMDGIAVRSVDVMQATAQSPVRLQVVGGICSGETWSAMLKSGTAVRIATGTPMPSGADAVIPREVVTWDAEAALIAAPIAAGRHVFPAGEDVRTGEIVLEAGAVLTGGQLGLLAALGHSTVSVIQRPVVAILATGDELVDPSTTLLRPGQVRESNSYALAAEIQAAGALPRLLGVARDELADLRQKIADGLGADALVICGGASVGDRDLVRNALAVAGTVMRFVGVAMKPGGPVAFGTCAGRSVFVLPGTPGAARVAYEILVRPALRAMLGHRDIHRPAVHARLGDMVKVAPGRRRFLWGRVEIGPSGAWVTPLHGQGTATLRSPAEADALIEIQPGDSDLPAGSVVTAHLLAADAALAAQRPPALALGVVGGRGAGKTTVIEQLIPALRRRGVTVAVIKHHAHFGIDDIEGTDTARYARAGAAQTLLAGPGGVVRRDSSEHEATLDELLSMVGSADLILVEGYSQSVLPKILVMRTGVGSDKPAPADPIVAVVGAAPEAGGGHLPSPPRFGWGAIEDLAEFLTQLLPPRHAGTRLST
jgi:molybdopterin molybdotransferase